MEIKDINGLVIKIDNLHKTIEQADNFRKLLHIDPQFQGKDKERKAYKEDVYQKLLTLK